MTHKPREYDREFTVAVNHRACRRLGVDTERGDVVRFVVQLEYFHDGEWREVVRYDHDGTAESEFSHDVTEEGHHTDIYHNGDKEATEYPLPRNRRLSLLIAPKTINPKNLDRFILGTNNGTGSTIDD